MEETIKKKRGRPSKADVEARKAEHQAKGWGGSRDGAGRKSRRSVEGEKLSETISFCVTPTAKAKFKALRAKGFDPVTVMVDALNELANLLNIKVEV